MNGQELRELINNKWGYSYDVQIVKIKDKIYFQIMWKYLEQASFHWTELEYSQHLENIASYITSWGVIEQVKNGIFEAKNRPRLGKAVSFSLDLGDQTSEWIV
jgi:hypothetical protein